MIKFQNDEKISEFLLQNDEIQSNLADLKNNFNNTLIEIQKKDIIIKEILNENKGYQIEIKKFKNELEDQQNSFINRETIIKEFEEDININKLNY